MLVVFGPHGGGERACIKACPTNCLTFGVRSDWCWRDSRTADARVETLREDGKANAGVYNPQGVGGTNVIYVLGDASDPERVWIAEGPARTVDGFALAGSGADGLATCRSRGMIFAAVGHLSELGLLTGDERAGERAWRVVAWSGSHCESGCSIGWRPLSFVYAALSGLAFLFARLLSTG